MISTTSEYALRALSCLASQPEGGSILGRELALKAGVPANYLAKILLTLQRAGLVAAARGTGGGYRLHRPAERIRLSDVVELFDRAKARDACVLGHEHNCNERSVCTAHHAWLDVRAAYTHFLTATTLADISRGSPAQNRNGNRRQG